MRNFNKPTLIISACIEHSKCRYDGSMIFNDMIKKLKVYVDFIPVCPEVGIGLPSPRKSLRIVYDKKDRKLIQPDTNVDYTEQLSHFSDNFFNTLDISEVDGAFLKSKSPTCGFGDVKMYPDKPKQGALPVKINGMFTDALMERFPTLLVETDGRTTNFNLREEFFMKIFTLADFKEVKKSNKHKALVDFHSQNKYLFMAFNQKVLKQMGGIVANAQKLPLPKVLELYEELLHVMLAGQISRKRTINVLEHILGYFKNDLSKEEKAFFKDTLELYKNKRIPLSGVVTILKSWVIRFDKEYLKIQTFFEPYPSDLVELTDSGKGL